MLRLEQGAPFQRLEFLGDAFLQFAVSMELRKRYPDKDHGELTSIRSALVRNVHLGRLLTRRYGVAATLAFFAGMEGERKGAIRAFVEAAGGDRWSVADVFEDQLGEGAQPEAGGQADMAPVPPMAVPRREDPRKPTATCTGARRFRLARARRRSGQHVAGLHARLLPAGKCGGGGGASPAARRCTQSGAQANRGA